MENKFLKEQKSMLAQLLASENITVIHDKKLETAAFDPINRKLYLPVFKTMTGPLYDLLVLHEVSHALNTPANGFHSSKHPKGSRFKGFLNVVEDARIEKLIKRKFPGGRSSMINGYKELLEMDFFGIKNVDPQTLPFIDRFNLYFKIGMTLNLSFTDEEYEFIQRGMNLETWKDVDKLALDLWDFAKDETLSTDIQAMIGDFYMPEDEDAEEGEEQDEKDSMKVEMEGQTEVEGEEEEDRYDEEERQYRAENAEGEEDEKTEESEETSESTTGQEASEKKEADKIEEVEKEKFDSSMMDNEGGGFGSSLSDFEEHYDEDPLSITDTNFRNHERELSDKTFSGTTLEARVPEDNWQDYVIDFKTMLEYFQELYGEPENFESELGNRYSWDQDTLNRWTEGSGSRWQNFVAHNKPIVRHMVKEFEARKSAAMHERSRVHQSGLINPSALYKYKFDDKIFKAVTSIPEGKNHGLVFYIDCSGSMQHVFGTVIEQTTLMAMFCQMVKIPFRIYGFTNFSFHRHDSEGVSGKLSTQFDNFQAKYDRYEAPLGEMNIDRTVRFFELFNDKMSKREFTKMGEYLVTLSDMGRCPIPLSGTPLNEVIILGIDMVNDFKRQYNLDICNTILLTDGDSSSGGGVNIEETRERRDTGELETYRMHHNVTDEDICTYKHRKTGTSWMKAATAKRRRYNRYATTSNLLQFFEKCTGQNIIGINIFPKFSYHMANDVDTNLEEARAIIRKKGYLATKSKGYSKLFSVPNKNLMIHDGASDKFDNVEREAKTSAITRAFKAMANGRKSQRMFLTEFVDMVS